jgi:hypothetical protein
MKQHTVQSLRQNGNKVRVIHRFYNSTIDEKIPNMSFDGECNVTQIDVTSIDGKDATGISYRAKGDQYNRKKGNMIALGRAVKQLIVMEAKMNK